MVARLVKKFSTIYGTRSLNTVFTRVRHWTLYRHRWGQWTPSTLYFIKIHHNFILESIYMSFRGPLPFPAKIQNAILISSTRPNVRIVSPTLCDINNIWWGVEILEPLIMQFSPASSHFAPLTFSLHCIHSSMALQPFVGPRPLLQFRNLFTQTVGLLGRVISPSQGRHLHTGIHALSGIRTHDPSVRESEDSWYLRPRGHSIAYRRKLFLNSDSCKSDLCQNYAYTLPETV
jgi:hypothetical protein